MVLEAAITGRRGMKQITKECRPMIGMVKESMFCRETGGSEDSGRLRAGTVVPKGPGEVPQV